MAKFLASGQRRDILVLVYRHENPRGGELKQALEAHYEERIKPREFQGALESLVDLGYLTRRVDGVHDRYELTGPGEQALLDHYDWLRTHLGSR